VTAALLLAGLRRRGIDLRAEGDRLRWRAPQGVVTPDDVGRLRDAKPELLRLLAPPEGWLAQRTLGWRAHLQAHDPDRANWSFCRELAADDWVLAQNP